MLSRTMLIIVLKTFYHVDCQIIIVLSRHERLVLTGSCLTVQISNRL
jgi:hypothetical protein